MKWNDLIAPKTSEAREGRNETDEDKLASLYLCSLVTHPQFMPQHPGMIATLIGFEADLEAVAEDTQEVARKKFLAQVEAFAQSLLASCEGEVQLPFDVLIETLSSRLQLVQAEKKLLLLLALMVRDARLKGVFRELNTTSSQACMNGLAVTLGVDRQDLQEALAVESTLVRLELVEIRHSINDLDDFIEPGRLLRQLMSQFSNIDQNPDQITERIFRSLCPLAPTTDLKIRDFAGAGDLQLMLDYLAQSEGGGKNLLIYGKPGTGKTELARTLAKTLNKKLYEVPTQTKEREPITGKVRLQSASMAQVFLQDQKTALLLFDEMEDAFRSARDMAKAWLNNILEKNPVPCIWISNDISKVDPAFLRRFDIIQELEGITGANAEEHLVKKLEEIPVTNAWRQAVVKKEWATPAAVENIRAIGSLLPNKQLKRNEMRLERLMAEKFKSSGGKATSWVSTSKAKNGLHGNLPKFRVDWLNTNPPLEKMAALLTRNPSARLCLYGPPGAGKTAFARHMAEQLGKPFELVSGSDLLAPYVGQSEENIAAAFDEAERKGAVLLLDEADTFLLDRNGRSQSWEVSTTNEFMVRLEAFDGIFMATTNRFEALDNAIMRRFHLKVEFQHMEREQVMEMLKSCVTDPHNLDRAEPEQISALNRLTPGLVAIAMQRLNLLGHPIRTRLLLRAVLEEQRLQGGAPSQSIGFTAPLS